jgi:AcrR family transcriptional regulator
MEHGPAVSTAHIANEVGLSQAALFKRFQTKENLLLEALAPPQSPGWIDDLGDAPDGRPMPDQLVEIATSALGFLRELVPRMMMLKIAGLHPHDIMRRYPVPPPVLAQRRLATWFAAAQGDGRIRVGDPAKLAMHFLGALHVRAFFAYLTESAENPADTDADYIHHLVETLFIGIQPEESP